MRRLLGALDGARDPDARFRVSELFCANTTWQPAVLALIALAVAVLLTVTRLSLRKRFRSRKQASS